MDDSVGLRMNGAAKLVPFPTGDLKAFPDAVAQVDTVAAASGSPHIAGGNNLILIDNDLFVPFLCPFPASTPILSVKHSTTYRDKFNFICVLSQHLV